MDEHANGIVLRYHPYSESTLIIRWLTLEHGRLDTIARGARRPKSPFRGKIDLFYFAEFTFARSRRSELHSLRELRLRDTFATLRSDLARLHYASYASALLTQTTEPGLPIPEIFNLFATFLRHLARHTPTPILPLAFELKLLTTLGLQPAPTDLRLSPAAQQIAESCLAQNWSQLGHWPETHIGELNAALHRFLEFHTGRILDQRTAAVNPAQPISHHPPDNSSSPLRP
jgi:DNA repair protein RecO (recombination protein O)